MITQDVSVKLTASDEQSYENLKAILAKATLPVQPILNDVLKQAHLSFSSTFSAR